MKKVCNAGVVIVNWNGADLTIPCVKSLLESEYIPEIIIVIDNASTDETIKILENAQDKRLITILNENNFGVACSVSSFAASVKFSVS